MGTIFSQTGSCSEKFEDPNSVCVVSAPGSGFCTQWKEATRAATNQKPMYTPKNTPIDEIAFILPNEYKNIADKYSNLDYDAFRQTTLLGSTLVEESSAQYNCHGYSFEVSERQPRVWIGGTCPENIGLTLVNKYYVADGSYVLFTGTGWPHPAKVLYERDHSGVTSTTTGYVISKWAYGPLVKHPANISFKYGTVTGYYVGNVGIKDISVSSPTPNACKDNISTFNLVANPDGKYFPQPERFEWVLKYANGSLVASNFYTIDGGNGAKPILRINESLVNQMFYIDARIIYPGNPKPWVSSSQFKFGSVINYTPSYGLQGNTVNCTQIYVTRCSPLTPTICWQEAMLTQTPCPYTFKNVTKVTDCEMYRISASKVYPSDNAKEGEVVYTFSVPSSITLYSNPVINGSATNLPTLYFKVNNPTGNEVITLNVIQNICGVAKTIGTYTYSLSVQFPKVGKPSTPKTVFDGVKTDIINTDVNVIFGKGTGDRTTPKIWSFYKDGVLMNESEYITLNDPVQNAALITISFKESIFNNSITKSAVIQAKYVNVIDGGCITSESELSNPVYLISQNYVPGAPTVGNGTYTGICAGEPITLKSNDVGSTAKKWEFFLGDDTTPLTTTSGAYVVNSQSKENINVTINEDIMYEDYAKISARYTPVYNRVSPKLKMTMTRPAENITPRDVIITGRCTQGSVNNPNSVRIKLVSGGLDYKNVTLSMRARASNTSGSTRAILGGSSLKPKRDANGDYYVDFIFPDYLAGYWIEYQFRVQVGCNTYNMYAYPVNQGERTLRNFQLNPIPNQATFNIETSNGRLPMYVDPNTGPRILCRTDIITVGAYDYVNNQKIVNPSKIYVKIRASTTQDPRITLAEQTSETGEVTIDLSNPAIAPILEDLTKIYVIAWVEVNSGQCRYEKTYTEEFSLLSSEADIPSFISPFPDNFQGRPQNQFYCKGNNLFLYPEYIREAQGYRWKTGNGNLYYTDRLKIPIDNPSLQTTNYYVAAFDGKCYSNYSRPYFPTNINQDISQTAPSPLTFTGFTDAIDVIDNTKYRVASVAPTNSSETGLEYVWYYGKMAQASNATVDCVYPPYTENLGFYKSGIDDKTVLTRYRYYNNIYEYLERCDYVVMTKNGSCYSDPLIVYTGNPQLPQYRRGFDEESTSSDIKIYPNPAKDELHIANLSSNDEYSIFNIAGEKVISGKDSPVNVSSLMSGFYIVKVQQQYFKFIKE
jgi:hypothetical protein